MEDHEELEGDNTPGASPRDEKEAEVQENHVDADKVYMLFLNVAYFPCFQKSSQEALDET